MVASVTLGRIQSVARADGRIDPVGGAVRSLISPVVRPLVGTMDGVGGFFSGMGDSRRLAGENARLKSQLAGLAVYSERIDYLTSQLDQLRRSAGLGPLPGKERVQCEVIGFSAYENRVTLSAGAERGLKPGMPVMNGDGLVGLIQTVGRGQSEAVLVTNIDLKIGGIDISRKPPPAGLLKGRGSPLLELTLFDPKAPVQSGDTIVTAGLSAHIPGGIIIGRVISIEDDSDFGTRRALIDPRVSLGSLREVQVLK